MTNADPPQPTSAPSAAVWQAGNAASAAAHRAPGEVERPERLDAVLRGFEAAESRGLEIRALPGRRVDDETLLRGHSAAHLETVAEACRHGFHLAADTYTTLRSEEIAREAVGAAVDVCAAVLGSTGPRYGFSLVRPPGHHAERDRAMGFCLYSNVALAALEMQARGLARRIAIVDWDVHHGNGTEQVLWELPDLLFVSLHQHPLYPGTGAVGDVGAGEGEGWTVNLPLAPGAGDPDFLACFDRIVVPMLEAVEPELVIISAGYDAHHRDPLGSLEVTGAGYGQMTQRLMSVGCPVVAVLEGGYDLTGITEGVTATLDAFAGREPEAPTPGAPSRGTELLLDQLRPRLSQPPFAP